MTYCSKNTDFGIEDVRINLKHVSLSCGEFGES